MFDVYPLYDINIVRAEGSYVWDDKGTKYLDMYGGHAVISIGHTHPHYVEMVTNQLKNIGFYSNSVIIAQQKELAEKLGRLSGKSDYQLFLCNSGAEANENALKLASFFNGKKKVIAMKGSFHGRTSLAVAATDNPNIVAPVNQTDNVIFVPLNDEQALEEAFLANKGEISSVILEGIQGVGGIREASRSFLWKIRSLCDQHDAVYIADSVQCGCARSGQYYSHDWAGVSADIYSMAKGIGNGFPMGAISISPRIALSVIARTSAPTPARSASSSITSVSISVESISKQISRRERRNMSSFWNEMSMPSSVDSCRKRDCIPSLS